MGELRPWHIVVIVVVAFVLFGYKKLPDATRSLGRSLRILKTEVKTLHEDDSDKTVKAEAPVVAEPPLVQLPPRAVEAPRAVVPEAVTPVAPAAPVAARAPVAPADSDLR